MKLSANLAVLFALSSVVEGFVHHRRELHHLPPRIMRFGSCSGCGDTRVNSGSISTALFVGDMPYGTPPGAGGGDSGDENSALSEPSVGAGAANSEGGTLRGNRFSKYAPDASLDTTDFREQLKENMKADLERRRREDPNRGNQPAKTYLDNL
mmetsp:Transcript_18457/g.52958  ORF Transcript_18457/g.52958 Transcript_18457/m.52958 type:complete len:153 (+) Transcript_18457:70-528(+)